MRFWLLTSFCVLGFHLGSACSSSTTNDGTGGGGAAGMAASGGAGGTDAASGGAGGASGGSSGDAALDVPAVDTGAPACDPTEKPEPSAVYVSPDGDDNTGSGSPEKPLASLGQAIKLAAASASKLVIANQGTYKESVVIDAAVAGVAVRGGFERTGSVWDRDCDPMARQKTVIDSPSTIGVRVDGVQAKLQTLTVLTKATGATTSGKAGESQYGVFVTGDSASVSLVDVRVVAGSGGDGGLAVKTISSQPTPCDGLSNCSTGGAGVTATAASDAPASTFDLSGHVPGNGADAAPAQSGKNGTAGLDDGTTKTGCHSSGCAGVCTQGTCAPLGNPFPVKGAPGTCGCGGLGGVSGGGGWGGGASVALFVAGKGVVTVAFSELTSQKGGKGSAGKTATAGAVGTEGAQGASVTCHTTCYSASSCGNCEQNSELASGGTKGGMGGKGGDGGPGGNGAGGASIGIVRVGGALVTLSDGSVSNPGQGGLGAGSAPAGQSATELIVAADGG